MDHMDDPDWFYVRPNARQPLHVRIQRLRLGRKAFDAYQHGSMGSGYFALWIPTGCGGRLVVEMPESEGGTLSLWKDGAALAKVAGWRLEHQVPVGAMGRFDVHVSPHDRALRASFTAEAWPDDAGKPLIPWNFWFFPYASQPATSRHDWSSHDVQMSAMRKLDRAAPPLPGSPRAEDWERAYHSNRHVSEWAGHCDPGAFASYYFEQPEAKTIGGQAFTRDELELLAAEWSGSRLNADGGGWNLELDGGGPVMQIGSGPRRTATFLLRPSEPIAVPLLRSRYIETLERTPTAAEEGAILRAAAQIAAAPGKVTDAFGLAASTLWGFLDRRLLRERRPMVGDFGAIDREREDGTPVPSSCAEVWNHAAVKLVVTLAERGADEPTSLASSPLRVGAKILIATNRDVAPELPRPGIVTAADLPPAQWDGANLSLTAGGHEMYEETVDLDFTATGDCSGGRWRDSKALSRGGKPAWAPRLFGIPGKPRLRQPSPGQIPPGNPAVTDAFVTGALTLRRRFR